MMEGIPIHTSIRLSSTEINNSFTPASDLLIRGARPSSPYRDTFSCQLSPVFHEAKNKTIPDFSCYTYTCIGTYTLVDVL